MTPRPVIFISATGQRPHQGRVVAILLPLIALVSAGSLGWWFAHPSLPAPAPVAAAQAPSLPDAVADPYSKESNRRLLAQLQDKIRRQEQQLGPWHRDTLETRLEQAHMWWDQHKHEQAIEAFRSIHAIQQRTLDPGHPDTLRTRSELASALANYNRADEAEPEYRAILALRQRTLGAEHPDTIQTLSDLAENLMYQSKYPEAEAEFRTLSGIQERLLGASHPDTFRSRSDIATMLMTQRRYPEAEAHYRSLISDLEKTHGAQNKEALKAHLSLAYVLEQQNRLPEALAHAQRAEVGLLDLLGPNHPEFLVSPHPSGRIRQKIEEADGKQPGN